MKKQHIQRGVLIIAALVIWGNNIIQLVTGVLDQEETDAVSVDLSDSLNEMAVEPFEAAPSYTYQARFRDPFQPDCLRPPARPSKPVHRPEKKPAEIKIPSLHYRGVIQSRTGQMATVEKVNGEIVFTRVSDEVDGITIRKITEDSLQCQFQNKRFWLRLQAR